ncbi:MAG: hypothetical protein OZ917_03355 [Candidatus Brocadiaceae bacterium]|nr:hypothetical protein [Candidatus Brocadiaceae bacterium]
MDRTKIKGNAQAKRMKDCAGFEKWLSEIEEEIAAVLKKVETIDKQEDNTCKGILIRRLTEEVISL